jgi:hypothetical protein
VLRFLFKLSEDREKTAFQQALHKGVSVVPKTEKRAIVKTTVSCSFKRDAARYFRTQLQLM